MAAKASKAGMSVPVFIDLNLGMNRTGIAPANAIELYKFWSSLDGIKPVGLHGYDGHIRDKNFQERKKKCDEAFAQVEQLKNELVKLGFPVPVIVVGGSPTFPIHAKRKDVDCSPGTFIYWDAGYQQGLTEQPFLPAALVISRIISHPEKTYFVLIWVINL